jgi:hypothetical protein
VDNPRFTGFIATPVPLAVRLRTFWLRYLPERIDLMRAVVFVARSGRRANPARERSAFA